MGGGGESPPSQATTFTPWKGQKPYLKDIYAQAQQQSQNPMSYYPGQTVAAQDEATIAAQNAAEQRARAGSPLLRSAQGYTNDVLSGKYLTNNPYLDDTYDRAAAGVRRNFDMTVLPDLETRFAGVGGLTSSAYQAGLGEAGRGLAGELSGLATDIYGGNYQAERDRQTNAVGQAQPLSEADYNDINTLGQVGAARQGYSQQLLDELINRFNFAQQEPSQRLARYAGTIGSPVGTSATQYGNTKVPGNTGTVLAQILGSIL